uniref:Uncharacterized protein n=1 Tax=Anopheles maculatus TaxID=74869 RepID=A0A182S9N6_9DIPT
GSGGNSSSDEQSVVALSNVKLVSAPIDERHQHAGSDIEVCCIDGRDFQEHEQHTRVKSVQREATTASYHRQCIEFDGQLPAPAGERERIDERCYVDDGGEKQQQLANDTTGERGSLLRGLECVSTSSLPTAVGPNGEDEEGKGRSKGLGQQLQLTPNGTVARTVQTCTPECEEKSTQVSSKGGHTRTVGPLSSDSESENYYGTCSPPTVERAVHRPCANHRCYHPEGRECPSCCTQNDSASPSVLVEVTLSAHICVHHQQQQTSFSYRDTSNSCHCSDSVSRVLRDSATNTQESREGDESDGSGSVGSETGVRTEGIQSRTGHRNNPSSADSGIIIIDDDVDGATVDDGSYSCQQPRVDGEPSGVNVVKGPAVRKDQHQHTQTGPFDVNFIDSAIRPQGSPNHRLVLPSSATEQEALEGACVRERVQSESRNDCSSTASVPLEGTLAQDSGDNEEDTEVVENSSGAGGGVECFEASQRLKRLEERFRGFAYTKKYFRESFSHDLSGRVGRESQKYGGAGSHAVGGSLPSLLVCAGHPDARSSSTDYANTNTFAAGSPPLRPSAEDDERGYGGSDANVTLLRSPTQRNRRGLLSSVSTLSLGSSSLSSSARGFGAAASSASAASESSVRKPARTNRDTSALLACRKTSSLNCLQQDATRDEDDTERYLLSNRTNHNNNRSTGASFRPTPSLNRAPRSSWTRPILPPLSSSLLSLSASSLLSLSCLDLERQHRQRAASQAAACSKNQETEIVAEGTRQDKNNNGPVEENGLSKAVSLPSLLTPVVHQDGTGEYLEAVGNKASTEHANQNQLRYQRQPRAVEELRRNTDTPESSGAESEEICKIFPGGKARIGDPLEVVETVVVGGSTEEEDNDDDEEEEEDEEDDEDASSDHIVLPGAVGEDILNNNHTGYRGGEGDDGAQQDEFVQLEKLLAADPHTNCEFDTRHLQDYEPEVYRIKYCYDELEEELEEQQEQEAANDLLVVLRGTS